VAVAWPIIQAIFQAIGNFITGVLMPIVRALWELWVNVVWPAIKTALEVAWNSVLKPLLEALWRFITNTLMPAIRDLYNLWVSVVWPAIKTAIQTAWGIIEPILKAIWEWLKVTLPPVIDNIKSVFSTAFAGIQATIQAVKGVWDGLVGAVQSFWSWLSSHVFSFKIETPSIPALPGGKSGPAFKDAFGATGGIGRSIGGGAITNRTVVVNVDARGAAPGVERDVRRAVEDVLRLYGLKADARIRTGY
jgi:hypothetical protein